KVARSWQRGVNPVARCRILRCTTKSSAAIREGLGGERDHALTARHRLAASRFGIERKIQTSGGEVALKLWRILRTPSQEHGFRSTQELSHEQAVRAYLCVIYPTTLVDLQYSPPGGRYNQRPTRATDCEEDSEGDRDQRPQTCG